MKPSNSPFIASKKYVVDMQTLIHLTMELRTPMALKPKKIYS